MTLRVAGYLHRVHLLSHGNERPLRIGACHTDEPVGVGIWQGSEQNPVHQAENGRVCSHAQCESQHRKRGKARGPAPPSYPLPPAPLPSGRAPLTPPRLCSQSPAVLRAPPLEVPRLDPHAPVLTFPSGYAPLLPIPLPISVYQTGGSPSSSRLLFFPLLILISNFYSYFRATTGSIDDALRAGMKHDKPAVATMSKITPVRINASSELS